MMISKLLSVNDGMKNSRLYKGAEPKFGITINNKNYLVKEQKSDWDNVLSEYVASRFIQACGALCQNTLLAQYKGKICVLCEDFTDAHGKLKEFGSINSSFDTERVKYDYYFNDVLHLLSRLKHINLDYTIMAFWRMYIMDAILANPDRHMGNWGVCRKDGVYRLSPIYDNGASLFPRASGMLIDKEWMHERTFVFPNSKIMFEDRKRSSYKNVIQSGICPDIILEQAKGLDVIGAVDWATEGLSEDRKRFYRTIVYYRFNSIILGRRFKWKGMVR